MCNIYGGQRKISFLIFFLSVFPVVRYTTDGGSRENLEKGTIRGDTVFSGEIPIL
jgi:hypothetical protein